MNVSKEFLPDARIGIIQQNKVKVDNKDIVIVIQSISYEKLPNEVFDNFGLSQYLTNAIIISSQVFSRCLQN